MRKKQLFIVAMVYAMACVLLANAGPIWSGGGNTNGLASTAYVDNATNSIISGNNVFTGNNTAKGTTVFDGSVFGNHQYMTNWHVATNYTYATSQGVPETTNYFYSGATNWVLLTGTHSFSSTAPSLTGVGTLYLTELTLTNLLSKTNDASGSIGLVTFISSDTQATPVYQPGVDENGINLWRGDAAYTNSYTVAGYQTNAPVMQLAGVSVAKISDVTSAANAVSSGLSNNTVNAGSIFAQNTYVPAGNLTNAWRIWSITTNYTSASQLSLTLPSALVVRYTLLLPTNGYASGLALACTINGNTQSIYNAAGTKTDTSSAYASKTNIFWPVTAGTFTSPTYPAHATITFTPGNASSGWGGVHYSSVFFAGDIRDGYPSRHVVDGSSFAYQSVTNANIFWVSGATNHWFMSNAVVITEVLQ